MQIILALIALFIFAQTAQAKVLPQARKSTARTASNGISVYPRLRADRKAVIVNFANLQNAKGVSYMLTYQTSTQQEGAMGGINLTGTPSHSQELLFGTCSKGICRYHTGINNARLEVSYTTTSGKKYLKKFKIKV